MNRALRVQPGREGRNMANDILSGLNPSQIEAVQTTEGYVRVIAGAGSGKTRALSHRFAYLVNELGILPGNILCVTFTNKAANEMRQRIHNLTGDNDTGYINTFHGFCVSILQEDSHAVQYPKKFLVLDNEDINDMLKIIYEERGLSLRDMTFSSARDMIEMQKLVRKPEYYLDLIRMSADALREKYESAHGTDDIIFYGYLCQQKKCFGLDYNDLIKFSLYIFREQPEIRLKWQKRLEYIMIDEFQDIDTLQYELMEVLGGYHRIFFFNDTATTEIYTWRGASVRFLLDFDRHFPGTKTIMMLDNYRSTPEILNCANSLIAKNTARIKKDLVPNLPSGEKAICYYANTAAAEAEWIVKKMQQMHENGIPYRDMTALYRAHYVTRNLEEALLKAKVPYTIYSGVQFFGRMEIKDALSYLRMIAYKDDLSFRRIVNVPTRMIGRRRMAFLEEKAAAQQCTLYEAMVRNLDHEIFRGTKAAAFVKMIETFAAEYEQRAVSEVLADILDESGYEAQLRTEGNQERLDNLAELRQSVFEFERSCGEEVTLDGYLRSIAMFTNADTADQGDSVRLMTVHAAKGLEFPYVFLCGMNEGIFPSRKIRTKEGMEEERRLAFVAVTRAQKQLFLSEAAGRNFDGSPRYPSRFLLDIDPSYLIFEIPPKAGLIEESRSYFEMIDRQIEIASGSGLFGAGDRVRHAVFGEGEVVSVDAETFAYEILFDGMKTPRKISARVKLEKV